MEQLQIEFEQARDLNEYQHRVWMALSPHRGRSNAALGALLEAKTGMKVRRVRAIMSELIEMGLPIGSTPHRPAGYYIIQTHVEAVDVCNRLKGHAISILRRCMHLRGWDARTMSRQIEIDLK